MDTVLDGKEKTPKQKNLNTYTEDVKSLKSALSFFRSIGLLYFLDMSISLRPFLEPLQFSAQKLVQTYEL